MTDMPSSSRQLETGEWLRKQLEENRPTIALYSLILALVLLIAIFLPGVVNPQWASNVLLFSAPLGLLAASQTLTMLTRGIDLSVTAVATGAAYLMATNPQLGGGGAILLGLVFGAVVGAFNGVGVGLFGVMPLIMTLATAMVTIGLLTVYSQSAMARLSDVPDFVQIIGGSKLAGIIPYNLPVWILVAVAIIFMLRRSGYGRLLYAVGDNETACRLSGVRVWQVIVCVYAISGVLAALAGILLVGSTNAADLGLANTYLLPSVAAAVIGGVSIFGGRGGYMGAIAGALVLTIMNSLLTYFNASEPVKQILYGVVILALAALYVRFSAQR